MGTTTNKVYSDGNKDEQGDVVEQRRTRSIVMRTTTNKVYSDGNNDEQGLQR